MNKIIEIYYSLSKTNIQKDFHFLNADRRLIIIRRIAS